jgi:RNA polymerase sigma-70 factor (ECF subfamily)
MNSSKPTEQDLLNGAKAYDLATLTVIYQQYNPGIYRYAILHLGDDCLAEDCVAETFSRFLKALRAGQGPRNHLQAYLYRIAHNWITDYYRRQPPLPYDLDVSLQSSDPLFPETQADTGQEQQQVRLALRSLTPDQRQVITLRFIEGWENEEVASALQKPVGTIRALQFRALNSLRRLLPREEKEGVCEPEK